MVQRVILGLFIVIAAIEIGLFILIGKNIGFSLTFLLVIFTSVIGAWMAKRQGMQAIRLARIQIQNRDIPSDAILDGICVFIGGVLLISPGFFTDFIGFLFLIPYTRSWFKAWLKWWFANLIRKRTTMIFTKWR
jgi:UPF0716 protein FxsA